MAGPRPRQWLLVGVICGLVSVLVVRSALAVLLGSVKLVPGMVGVVLVWLFLRGLRPRGR